MVSVPQNVPLLHDSSDSEDDLEQGGLPTYSQAQSSVGFKLFTGNNGQPRNGKESVALSDVNIRMGFLRKVLGILSFQFLATVLLCASIYLTPTVRGFIQHEPWIILTLSFGSIGVLIAMFVHAHNVPLNYGLLAAWTVMQSLTVAAIVTFYSAEVVLQALTVTTAVVLGLFFYTLQSKHDFRKSYALLATVSMVFLVGGMLQIIMMSHSFNFFMSIIGAALFSVYLVFDIDAVMHHHSEEDYILACISIYMDIINLFINILQIINEANRN